MAFYTRIEVYQELKAKGMVPVFYHSDSEVCKQILQACYDGGARVFEFTNRGDGAQRVFEELMDYAREHAPEMKLGVGSVVDAPTASLYMLLGADFIVSPILSHEMAKVCNRRKVAWMPGCGTLTEISQAEEWGAEVVKIFPAMQVGGPAFIKAIKGPCPWTNIMPTGGVEPTYGSIEKWLKAGAFCVGIGSQLFTKDKKGNWNFDAIKRKVVQIDQWIQEVRN